MVVVVRVGWGVGVGKGVWGERTGLKDWRGRGREVQKEGA